MMNKVNKNSYIDDCEQDSYCCCKLRDKSKAFPHGSYDDKTVNECGRKSPEDDLVAQTAHERSQQPRSELR